MKRRPVSWGPYLRIAGIGATSNNTQPNHFDNAWLALPGIGFQVYPFSLVDQCGGLAKFLGPLRLFVEYNQVNYWGSANSWRPTEQLRGGGEYWRSINVNNNFVEPVRGEFWSGLYYLSANDFAPNYNSMVFGASVRTGLRIPSNSYCHTDVISMFSPYIAMESSYTGHPSYSWENRLLIGGGLRFTPVLDQKSWFNRLVFYAEYDYIPVYYYGYNYAFPSDPAQGPNSHSLHDVRVGINFSIGDWFH